MDTEQMEARCPGARDLGDARLPGYRFVLTQRRVASVERAKDSHVFGILWELPLDGESRLDRYEGVHKGLYERKTLEVELYPAKTVDEVVKASVYVSAASEGGTARGEDYIRKIVAAAARRSFPKSYLLELEQWVPNGR